MTDYEYDVHIDSVWNDSIYQIICIDTVLLDTMYNIVSDEEYDAMDVPDKKNVHCFIVLVETKINKDGECEINQGPFLNDGDHTDIDHAYNKEDVLKFAIKEAKKNHPMFFNQKLAKKHDFKIKR